MRFVSSLVIVACLATSCAFAAETGLPVRSFAQTWTALPTGRFTRPDADLSFKSPPTSVEVLSDARLGGLLDDAFASARDNAERRGIALSEMTAPWDQPKRTAFQRLRAAAAAYAGSDDTRRARFAATLARVVDGTGRSVATDGTGAADVDKAYASMLARQTGPARAAAHSEQETWRSYSDAFAAFSDLQTPGSAAGLAADLTRQRVGDLDSRR